MKLAIVLLVLGVSVGAQAELLKCVDRSGRISFVASPAGAPKGSKCKAMSDNKTDLAYGARMFGKANPELAKQELARSVEAHNQQASVPATQEEYALKEAEMMGWGPPDRTGEIQGGAYDPDSTHGSNRHIKMGNYERAEHVHGEVGRRGIGDYIADHRKSK